MTNITTNQKKQNIAVNTLETKNCIDCKKNFPLSEFPRDKRYPNTYRGTCGKCNTQRTLVWVQNSNSKAAVTRREKMNLNAERRAEEIALFEETKTKQCGGCKEVLSADNFTKGSGKFGLSSHCRKCRYTHRRNWEEKNKSRMRDYRNNYNKLAGRKLKLEVVKAYGGFCVCCGENEPDFLTIDHIFNDGAAHRKELKIKSGIGFYKWLKKVGFPKDRFQLLCHNCNSAKGFYGVCPHQEQH